MKQYSSKKCSRIHNVNPEVNIQDPKINHQNPEVNPGVHIHNNHDRTQCPQT